MYVISAAQNCPYNRDDSAMANTSCTFTSIDDFLAKAKMAHLNITTVISSCPAICALAWGTGNPDLSGIGANVSYIFQAILTFTFGPLLCLAYVCHKKFTESTNKKLEQLQDEFLDISAQFSITVAIAAVIRSYQHPPFYELAFLRALTTMQFLSILATAVTIGVCTEERKGARRITVIVIYGIIEFAFYVRLIVGLSVSKVSWATLHELSEACKAYSHIVPWSIDTPPPKSLDLIITHLHVNGFLKFLVLIGLILAGFIILYIVVVAFQFLVHCLLSQEAIFVGPISLAFAVGMLVEMVQMEHTRHIMKEVTGVEFQDNQWGFGQVIALLLWVPLVIKMFSYLIRIRIESPESATIAKTPVNAEIQTHVDIEAPAITQTQADVEKPAVIT